MIANYENVTVTFNSNEFKLFKSLAHRFYSLLLVTPSVFDDFCDNLKNVDTDVVRSLKVLHKLINDNDSSDLEITNFLFQLMDL